MSKSQESYLTLIKYNFNFDNVMKVNLMCLDFILLKDEY